MITEIAGNIVTLRATTADDLKDYRAWFTKGLDWTKWDAPWEEMSEDFAASFIDRLSKRIQKGPQELKTRFEIWVDNTHIGWVTSYYIENKPEYLAVGISIPEMAFWSRGIGREALEMWVQHLFQTMPLEQVYCETWSGNERMVRLALSIGFELIESDRIVEVNGKPYQKLKFKKTLQSSGVCPKPQL
ncbi:MAG: GNAT family N-acetyltransferase [Candidatus Cloacimonetes bacterium]|nr:GNAT family N-acetyltransferase [Candidatus Cloacimonadota bacterium]